jgi:hypothetical protein
MPSDFANRPTCFRCKHWTGTEARQKVGECRYTGSIDHIVKAKGWPPPSRSGFDHCGHFDRRPLKSWEHQRNCV